MRTRIFFLLALLGFSFSTLFAQKVYVEESSKLPSHPRILLKKGEEMKLLKQIKKDAMWTEVHNSILEASDEMISMPTNERIKTGMRLLSISRSNLHRIFFLSYAYRMTGQEKYFKRAEEEMLKAASFVDWNPFHFLDVAEMTMALAIGYDWLYNRLSADSKRIIETAIIEKGLMPSCDESNGSHEGGPINWFVKATSNWNQVCHGGITYGALAVWEKNPKLACSILNRGIEYIRIPMQHYAPDGAYPEGVGYWDYGTSYNAMFISAVEKIFGSDFGLCQMPGFLKTGEFILNMVTPGMKSFAFSDNSEGAGFHPTMFWFYNKTKDPTILYNHALIYKNSKGKLLKGNWMAPAAIIWGISTSLENPKVPESLNWKANGDNPVVAMRSSWTDPRGTFLGVKLGSPSINHGHMDVGSFVYEHDGILWAVDLGSENYNQVETAGGNMWDMSQESQRWDIFRYNNFVHNTLAFNRKLQIVKGKAEIGQFIEKDNQTTVISDLTPVYAGQVEKIRRAVSLVDKKYAVIEDEITTGKLFTMLSWNMTTRAKVTIVSDKVIMLEQDGKKVYFKVDAPAPIRWNIEPAQPVYSFNSPNPGVTLVRFDTDMMLNTKQLIKVSLIPEENKSITYNSAF